MCWGHTAGAGTVLVPDSVRGTSRSQRTGTHDFFLSSFSQCQCLPLENLLRNVVFRLPTEQRRMEVELRQNRQNRYTKFWEGLMITLTEEFWWDCFSKMMYQFIIFLEVYEGVFTHFPLLSDTLFFVNWIMEIDIKALLPIWIRIIRRTVHWFWLFS